MDDKNSLGAIPCIPITIKHGGMFYLPFNYVDSAGAVIVLTGYNARMQIWGSPTATGTAILDIGSYGTNLTQGTVAINPLTWQVSITVLSPFTAALENILSKGWYEFHFIDADGNDVPFFEGPVTFEPGGIR